jgi:hypothetical protein
MLRHKRSLSLLLLPLVLLLALMLLTACAAPSTAGGPNIGEATHAPGEEEHEDGPEHDEEHQRIPNNGAVIRIVAPVDGTTFQAGDDIIVEVETENFPLSEEGHHWHVFVDGTSWGMVEGGRADQVLRGVESGQHDIAVYLSNSAHEELEEGDTITVTVEEGEE